MNHISDFHDDLYQISSSTCFELVPHVLDKYRKKMRDKLKTEIAKLRDDDPISCNVSLFGTMDLGIRERAHTRTLTWLLDPKKEHGFGAVLLKSLLSTLNDNGFEISQERTNIFSEYPFKLKSKTTRYIDILAEGYTHEGRQWVMVIEAKIDAGETKNQLKYIEEFLNIKYKNAKKFRIFLSRYKANPKTAKQIKKWKKLSFEDLVMAFRPEYDNLHNKEGFDFLRLYITGVLKDICNWPIPIKKNNSLVNIYDLIEYLHKIKEVRR